MSIFKTERPNDIAEQQKQLAELNRQRKINRRKFIDDEKASSASVAIQESMEAIDNEATNTLSTLQEKRNNKLAETRLYNSFAMLESRLVSEGIKKCYDTAIFEMVYHGCWIDDAIKEKTIHQMLDTYHEVQETLDVVGIEKVSESNESAFIKNVKEIITEAAKKTAKRQTCKAKESCTEPGECKKIDFSMTDKEANDMDTKLSELGPEEMSELVKAKVLTVIQDEKQSGREKEKIFNDIDNITKQEDEAAKASADILSKEPQMDSVDTSVEPADPPEGNPLEDAPTKESVEEDYTSLLDAMLEATSLDISEEIEEFNAVEESKDTLSIEMEDQPKDTSIQMATRIHRTNKYIGTSLFECIMTDALANVKESIVSENMEVKNHDDIMDAAFMESVMVYTVLETFNTLGLYKFDHTSTRKLANYYMTRNK